MRSSKYLLLPIICVVVSLLSSCNEEEMGGPCQELIDSRYTHIEAARFVINNTDSMFVNYGKQSYGPGESPSTFATLVSVTGVRGTFAEVELQLTRVALDDDCIPTREHIVRIISTVDQLPFETKTYPIEGTLNPGGFATYSGSFIAEEEIVVVQFDGEGYLTISNYTPGERLTGKFEVTIRDGLTAGGRFDYDLTTAY